MSKATTALQNGLLYSLVGGLFGGSVWVSIFLIFEIPEKALIAPVWVVFGSGFVFWLFVGFLVGVYNTPSPAAKANAQIRTQPSAAQRILDGIGWFLYRLFVGIVTGIVATTAFLFLGISPWFIAARLFFHLDDTQLPRLESDALMSGFQASILCGFSGGVFGALIAARGSTSTRPAIGSRAARSSFLSFLLGAPIGAALGYFPSEDSRGIATLAVSVPIGILAGILGGVWTDIRALRGTR